MMLRMTRLAVVMLGMYPALLRLTLIRDREMQGTSHGRNMKLGWIGIGRMGYEMAARLAKGGADVTVWNRTRAKAEPLAQYGAKVADKLADLAACDIVFVMVSTYDDVNEVIAGPAGLLSGGKKPKIGRRVLVDFARRIGGAAFAARRSAASRCSRRRSRAMRR